MSLEKLFAEVFTMSEADVVDSLQLQDIPSWDSMTHMVFIVRFEELYQIQLEGDEIADIKSVGDARAALLARGVTP